MPKTKIELGYINVENAELGNAKLYFLRKNKMPRVNNGTLDNPVMEDRYTFPQWMQICVKEFIRGEVAAGEVKIKAEITNVRNIIE